MSIDKIDDLNYVYEFPSVACDMNDPIYVSFSEDGIQIGHETINWNAVFTAYLKVRESENLNKETPWYLGLY